MIKPPAWARAAFKTRQNGNDNPEPYPGSATAPLAHCRRSDEALFVSLGFDCCLQSLDGLVHWLGGDMDHSSEPLLQFEDHSDRASYSYGAQCQCDRRRKVAGGEQTKTGEQ